MKKKEIEKTLWFLPPVMHPHHGETQESCSEIETKKIMPFLKEKEGNKEEEELNKEPPGKKRKWPQRKCLKPTNRN